MPQINTSPPTKGVEVSNSFRKNLNLFAEQNKNTGGYS